MKNLPNPPWIRSENKVSEFQTALLQWYDRNKRDLPWRYHPSLYKTVVSEFMLQQTRVTTVLPFFENWLKKFPDFLTLANSTEQEVLKAWEGLGYYSRARNLHNLAKIAASWKETPKTVEQWKRLPGVGPYIAAAVTSISFGQAEAVCDGNVVRVLSRVFSISECFRDGATAQKKIRPLAQKLIHCRCPGDYNQAIMEIGATVCHRVSPQCKKCPIQSYCKSAKFGDYQKYPKFITKTKKRVTILRYWVQISDRLLLFTSRKDRLHGLFELPENMPANTDEAKIETEILAIHKRTIGNVEYTEEIHRPRKPLILDEPLPDGFAWMDLSKMNEFTLSGPHRKWIIKLNNLTSSSEVSI